MRAIKKVCTFGIIVAIGLIKHEWRGHRAKRCEGSQRGRYRRANNARKEEGNTCHAVKARQVDGLKRNAEVAGGRSTCRKTREKAKNPALKEECRVRYVGHGKLTWGHRLNGERETIKTRRSTQASGHLSKGQRARA